MVPSAAGGRARHENSRRRLLALTGVGSLTLPRAKRSARAGRTALARAADEPNPEKRSHNLASRRLTAAGMARYLLETGATASAQKCVSRDN